MKEIYCWLFGHTTSEMTQLYRICKRATENLAFLYCNRCNGDHLAILFVQYKELHRNLDVVKSKTLHELEESLNANRVNMKLSPDEVSTYSDAEIEEVIRKVKNI